MDSSKVAETFRGLLLRHRAQTGLSQEQLAARLGVKRRTVKEWEAGVRYPTAERLQRLIAALLGAGGLSPGREVEEAHALWAAVEARAPRMRTPVDRAWLAQLMGEREGARREDWGEAPDISGFVGRTDELAVLRGWVLEDRCRLVAVLGMGGIGKTSIAAMLAQEVASSFEIVYWRSLHNAPPLADRLAGAIGFLSDQRVVPPAAESERLRALLQLLRARRCLLVLDNFETLFEPGQREGRYRAGLAGYGRLLQAVGEAPHQSCLVLTSREAPAELAVFGGRGVRTLELGGLGIDEAQVLLAPKQLRAASEQWVELVVRFGGNGLALKLVGETIQELFGGDIGAFLNAARDRSVFGSIRRLLAEQIERSSPSERQVLRLLAVQREPVNLAEILTTLGPRIGRATVTEALEALRRRSLVERVDKPGPTAFTLQSVVLEYVTDRLVETVADEIRRGQPGQIIQHPLILGQTRDYVRRSQERLIGESILQLLTTKPGASGAEQALLRLLEKWRGRPPAEQGFGPGNVVNLLRLLRGDLRGLDLSRLSIRQAYLAEVEAQVASLAGADLSEAVLADAFGMPCSVAFSGDGVLLAAGTATGEVWLWHVAEHRLLATLEGHAGGVYGVAFSADGRLLACGALDGAVRVWSFDELGTFGDKPVATLEGHSGPVWGVALSADGRLLASGGGDALVKLWSLADQPAKQPLVSLKGHAAAVWGVALAADGQLLASGGGDGVVRLWDTTGGRPVTILMGHTSTVRGVALSGDGKLVASGSEDRTLRLWDATTGRPTAVLYGHTGPVRGVALSTDARLVASGSEDGTVRLWDTRSGRALATLQDHTGAVWSVALSHDGRLLASAGLEGTVRLSELPSGRSLATLQGGTNAVWGVSIAANGKLLASGSGDGTVRLWDTATGRLLSSLHGHTAGISSVALSADGHLLASGCFNGMLRLWETSTGRHVASLQPHTNAVWGVALTVDGQLLASSGGDGTVRLWDTGTQQLLATLRGHAGAVRGIALGADGRLLASGSGDGTVRLWDTNTHQLLATLRGHTGGVWRVALSADGRLVASSGGDGAVRLWNTSTHELLATLPSHSGGGLSVALSADGRLAASSGGDGTVRLWDTSAQQLLAILPSHSGGVLDVALSVDGLLVASSGGDGTVRLFETSSGKSLHVMRSARRYERMDITGLTGVTSAQRAALLALGAFEQAH